MKFNYTFNYTLFFGYKQICKKWFFKYTFGGEKCTNNNSDDNFYLYIAFILEQDFMNFM